MGESKSKSHGRRKKAKIKISSTKQYIEVLNGLFDMTEMELQVLEQFIKAKQGIDRKDAAIHPFDPLVKKEIAKRLGKKDDHYWLNGYVMNLKRKGALIPLDETGHYQIHPLLVPQGENEICIQVEWQYE